MSQAMGLRARASWDGAVKFHYSLPQPGRALKSGEAWGGAGCFTGGKPSRGILGTGRTAGERQRRREPAGSRAHLCTGPALCARSHVCATAAAATARGLRGCGRVAKRHRQAAMLRHAQPRGSGAAPGVWLCWEMFLLRLPPRAAMGVTGSAWVRGLWAGLPGCERLPWPRCCAGRLKHE